METFEQHKEELIRRIRKNIDDMHADIKLIDNAESIRDITNILMKSFEKSNKDWEDGGKQ